MFNIFDQFDKLKGLNLGKAQFTPWRQYQLKVLQIFIL